MAGQTGRAVQPAPETGGGNESPELSASFAPVQGPGQRRQNPDHLYQHPKRTAAPVKEKEMPVPDMKITAFNGSPRGDNSNTQRMVDEFLAGARQAGAE